MPTNPHPTTIIEKISFAINKSRQSKESHIGKFMRRIKFEEFISDMTYYWSLKLTFFPGHLVSKFWKFFFLLFFPPCGIYNIPVGNPPNDCRGLPGGGLTENSKNEVYEIFEELGNKNAIKARWNRESRSEWYVLTYWYQSSNNLIPFSSFPT